MSKKNITEHTFIMCVLFITLLFQKENISAQNELDVYRLSFQGITGTARSQAMGGAFSAVGADFSAASLNPAGLALYKKSEISLSPTFRVATTNSNFIEGDPYKISRNTFGFSQLGCVIHGSTGKSSDIVSYAVGFGYNQLENFNRKVDATAYNPYNSITDWFAMEAGRRSYNDLNDNYENPNDVAAMAYQTYSINPLDSLDPRYAEQSYIGAAPFGMVYQQYNRVESGRINDWNISFAGNWYNKLYIGAGLGIVGVKYTTEISTWERDLDNNYRYELDSLGFKSLNLYEEFATSGVGINGRLGLIYRPSDFIRAGFSITSPTIYTLKDKYTREIEQTFDRQIQTSSGLKSKINQQSSEGISDWQLVTPFRLTLGLAGFIAQKAMVSADFELIDYSNSRLSDQSGNYNYKQENDNIKNLFQTGYSFRLGAEYRLGTFYFRGGTALMTSPLNAGALRYQDFKTAAVKSTKGGKQSFTGGVGYRTESFFIDFAAVLTNFTDKFTVYSVPSSFFAAGKGISPYIINSRNLLSFTFSVGIRFGKYVEEE